MSKGNFASIVQWTVVLFSVVLFKDANCLLNANKTDTEMNLEECLHASLDPQYYMHPDKFLLAIDIIKRHGFPAEVHHVTSEDGYILELHRIPYTKSSPPGHGSKLPVFIQHGIMASSVNWILPPVESALAYRIANLGYDVWIGNVRGSKYSSKHVSMHYKEDKYWDFSWHEMGYYDLPAIIDYILDSTNHTKLTYVGHSMGCTMFFVCMSTRPEYNAKIDMMFALAPVAYCSNATSFFKLLAPFAYNLQRFYQYLGKGMLIPDVIGKIMNPFFASACSLDPYINCHVCSNIYFNLFNSDGAQMNYTMLPVITQHFPDRVSTKTVTHYGQLLISNEFQHFDDRLVIPEWIRPPLFKKGPPPPKYNLSAVTVPTVVFYAERDNLADPKDVMRLVKKLPNVKATIKVCYPYFNHNDFLFGVNVNELVYDKLLSILLGNWEIDYNCEKKYVVPTDENRWSQRSSNLTRKTKGNGKKRTKT